MSKHIRKARKIKGSRWCEVEITLNDGRLSICGTAGEIIVREDAEARAFGYWLDFFEGQPEEIIAMNKRCGSECYDAETAAQYVVDNDGPLHGVDVDSEDADDIFVVDCCGQIRDEIAQFFPEVTPFFRFHLNDMNSACEHQEARGERYETHPGAECLDCGWKLGHGWSKRELPPGVVEWAKTGKGTCPPEPEPAPTGIHFAVSGKRSPKGSPAGAASSEPFTMNGWATTPNSAAEQARRLLGERYDHIYIHSVDEVVDGAVA